MEVPIIMENKILVMEICSSRGAGCLLQGIMCKKLTRTKQPFTNESIPPLNINPSTKMIIFLIIKIFISNILNNEHTSLVEREKRD